MHSLDLQYRYRYKQGQSYPYRNFSVSNFPGIAIAIGLQKVLQDLILLLSEGKLCQCAGTSAERLVLMKTEIFFSANIHERSLLPVIPISAKFKSMV